MSAPKLTAAQVDAFQAEIPDIIAHLEAAIAALRNAESCEETADLVENIREAGLEIDASRAALDEVAS